MPEKKQPTPAAAIIIENKPAAEPQKPKRATRICVDCGNPYEPTGNCQKRCKECYRKTIKSGYQHRKARLAKLASEKPAKVPNVKAQTEKSPNALPSQSADHSQVVGDCYRLAQLAGGVKCLRRIEIVVGEVIVSVVRMA